VLGGDGMPALANVRDAASGPERGPLAALNFDAVRRVVTMHLLSGKMHRCNRVPHYVVYVTFPN